MLVTEKETKIVKWSEVLAIKNGKNQRKVENPNGAYPIYGSGGVMGYADDYICEKHTVIIGRKGSINNPIYITEKFWNVDTAFGLTAGKNLSSKYLYYFCIQYDFLRHNKATTIPSLTKADLLKVEIPLPPLETQKLIAQILDDAAALHDKTQQLLEEYDSIAQSMFLEIFGNPVTNPKNWELKNLKKSVTIFKDGPFGSNLKSAHYTETGVRIIRLQNIGVNEFVNKSKSYVSEEHAKRLRNYTCLPGDILIATMGTPNIRACRFPDYLDKALNKADCLQLRPDPKVAIQDYLLFLINSHGFFHLVTKFFHGQTRSRVSMGQMAKLSIPIPPLDLQHKFAVKLALIEKQKDLAKLELKESKDLFNCLLQKAFKGELVN